MTKAQDIYVWICIPSGEHWRYDFCFSLIGLVVDFDQSLGWWVRSQRLAVRGKEGSVLPQMRQQLIEAALRDQATHVLFLDSDQTFPPETLRRLLLWNKPIVACNVATKRFPAVPTARLFDMNDHKGKCLYTVPGSTGLKKIWRVGTGVMLIDLSVMRDLPKPWFAQEWVPAIQDFIGEDWFFCKQLEKAEIPIYVDQGLSWQIGHVGKYIYSHDVVLKPDDAKFCGGEQVIEIMKEAYHAVDKRNFEEGDRSEHWGTGSVGPPTEAGGGDSPEHGEEIGSGHPTAANEATQ